MGSALVFSPVKKVRKNCIFSEDYDGGRDRD